MSVERTLAKVDEDLRCGDVQMARTRLESLVASLPRELVVRERLAELCRQEGDLVEAGRWSYLADARVPAEVEAFERACGGDPVRIMRALRWRGRQEAARSDTARERLADVRRRAEAKAGTELAWEDTGREAEPGGGVDWFGLGCLLVVVLVIGLAVVGAWTVVTWVF